jgi:hypothetical protein
MAAIAFNPLEYAHELEASGVPREQAEVHAKAMATTFLHNFDALVTRDYLDTRFTEFETRVSASVDSRLSELNSQFTEFRHEIHSDINGLRTEMRHENGALREDMLGKISELRDEMHREISRLREEMHREMGNIRGTLKLHSWMSAMLIAGVFVPMLQKLVA